MTFDQQEFDIRCEWGAHGVTVLAPISDVVIIVVLGQCSSGKELIERGFANDVMLAAQRDVSGCAPLLVNDAYRRAAARPLE